MTMIKLLSRIVPYFMFIDMVFPSKSHKVFRSVVVFITIDVVYDFIIEKISSKFLLNYQSMLLNISINSLRMFRLVYSNIATTVFNAATFPPHTSFASKSTCVRFRDSLLHFICVGFAVEGISRTTAIKFGSTRKGAILGGLKSSLINMEFLSTKLA